MTTVVDVMARERTENQRQFAEWLIGEGGFKFRTAGERAAFVTGAILATRTYTLYQTSKPTSVRYVKPSRRKAAK